VYEVCVERPCSHDGGETQATSTLLYSGGMVLACLRTRGGEQLAKLESVTRPRQRGVRILVRSRVASSRARRLAR